MQTIDPHAVDTSWQGDRLARIVDGHANELPGRRVGHDQRVVEIDDAVEAGRSGACLATAKPATPRRQRPDRSPAEPAVERGELTIGRGVCAEVSS